MADVAALPHVPTVLIHEEREVYNYPSMRPPIPQIDPYEQDFEFFQFESEYRITRQHGLQIFMYGETLEGNSVTVRTDGFDPHFSIKAPQEGKWDLVHHEMFWTAFEQALKKKLGNRGEASYYRKLIKNITYYHGTDLYDYHGEDPETFIKVEVAYPKLVRECRLLLEYPHGKQKTEYLPEIEDWWPTELPCPVDDPYKDKHKYSGYPRYFQVYEANLDYMLRFQVDHKIRATGWVKIKKENFRVVDFLARSSTSQVEIYCPHTAVTYSSQTTKKLPPLSVYSCDAECRTNPEGGFPKAVYYEQTEENKGKREKSKGTPIPGSGEPMIQMGFQKIFGNKSSKGIHMIGSSAPIKDADEVYCYKNETNFLRGFKMDIQNSDPTFIAHYNGCNFDTPYLIDRMKQNGLWESFGDLGRLTGVQSRYYNSTFNSSAHKTEKIVTNINGRVQIDVMQCVKREKKLRSYGLNAVAGKFLEKNKVEMDYHNINNLQDGTPKDRSSLAYYCIIDSVLPWELIVKLKMIMNYIQMAYVAGVSIQQLLDRGQQLRMLAQMYHYAKDTKDDPIPNDSGGKLQYPYVIPVHPTYMKFPEEKFEGAVVIDAVTGLHVKPVTTLDFNSLYPSIIIGEILRQKIRHFTAHNLCYSTCLSEESIAKYKLVEGIHYKGVPDWVQHPDGSVTQERNPKNPRFLLTPEIATKNTIEKLGLVEGVHYVSIQEEEGEKPVLKILGNEATREAFSRGGLEYKTHYTFVRGSQGDNLFVKFVACKVGVLVTLLKNLLAKRKEVRGQAEHEIDATILSIIDALQNAYKTMANSMYGATGTGEKGYLPKREVAETVTRYGRGYILLTKYLVESKFNKKNGYPFNAKIIYGDTDSVFVRHDDPEAPLLRPQNDPWKYNLVDSKTGKTRVITSPYDCDLVRDYGLEMSKYMTQQIGIDAMCLAYEKSYDGILLVSKKRYAGHKLVWGFDKVQKKYTLDPGQTKFSATGLECVRRDSCPLVSEMVETILKKVIVERDVPSSIKYAREEISNLLQAKMKYSKLIITRCLSRKPKDYKVKSAHVTLAERIEKRDPGNAYKLGDRVEYVVVSGSKGQKTYELGEDPLFAFENGISPNYNWYLENQLKKPLQRIFYYVFKNEEVLKQMMNLEEGAEWIKTHGLSIDKLTTADLIDEDELEEDREEEDTYRQEFQEGDDIYESAPKPVEPLPMVIENVEPSKKRKAVTMADFLGVSFKSPKLPESSQKKTKKERDREHLRQMKKQQNAMDKSVSSSMLFHGKHTRKIVKVSTASSKPQESLSLVETKGTHGITKYVETMAKCQVCSNPTKSSRKAICERCESNIPAILEAKNRAANRIEKAEAETWRCLGICETCVKNNPTFNVQGCRNVDCENLWDRMTAWKDLSKEQRLKVLDW